MTNLECVIACLTSHREARSWTDEAVATDLLAQLGLDAAGKAKHAKPIADPNMVTEDEVQAHEAAAEQATAKAKAARDQLQAQIDAGAAKPPAAPAPSHEDVDLAPATFDANAPPVPAPPAAAHGKPGDKGKRS